MRNSALPRLALSLLVLAALPHLGFGARAWAEEFPDRPITFMVPLAPGGGMDFIARTISQKMSERLGQSVVVENRPGGGTIVATGTPADIAHSTASVTGRYLAAQPIPRSATQGSPIPG